MPASAEQQGDFSQSKPLSDRVHTEARNVWNKVAYETLREHLKRAETSQLTNKKLETIYGQENQKK